MGSLSLTEKYDELRIGEKIIQNEMRKDEMYMINLMNSLEKKSRMTKELHEKLKEAEKKSFHLEQKIRTLTIQLDEEKEAKVDLEIENIKLRKDLTKLKKSLESVNNNCYEDVNDLNLSEVSDISEDKDITIIGGDTSDLSLLHELSDFRLLSDETLDHSPFSSTASTNVLLLEKEIRPSPLLLSTVKKAPLPPSCVKKTYDTYTKKIHSMPPPPPVTVSGANSKKARRRSKSVDFHIGEKTMIVPEVCELCVQKAMRRRAAEDSPTLPWCPHQETGKALYAISMNPTPVRSNMFKNILNSSSHRRDPIYNTSTPVVKSILKPSPTTTVVNSGQRVGKK